LIRSYCRRKRIQQRTAFNAYIYINSIALVLFLILSFRSCNSENDLRERTSFSITFAFTTWTYGATSSWWEWCINTCYYVTTRTTSSSTTTSSSCGKLYEIYYLIMFPHYFHKHKLIHTHSSNKRNKKPFFQEQTF